MSAEWRQKNLICQATYDAFGMGEVDVTERPIPAIRPDLLDLFERDELAKYLTDNELPATAEA
jgi:succinate dehydrogenase / fumarate reductase flavoprotein subunit